MKTITHPIVYLALFIVALILGETANAQQGINYQGVARDANSELIVNTEINLEFNINKTTANGTTVYSETHTVLTDVNGVFSVILGQGISVQDFETDINWAEDQHFLNVWLNGEEMGTSEFKSVPFSKAIGKWQAHKNGVAPKGTGGSIYIGENSGELDDFSDNHNVGLGDNTLANNTSGVRNTAIGNEALFSNETGTNNFAAGYKSLYTNTGGIGNIGMGIFSLHLNRSGNSNVAIGSYALRDNITGEYNIALGSNSLRNHESGEHNISLGYQSLLSNISGDFNVAIGREAGRNNVGEKNVFLGYRAGFHEEGSNKLYVDNTPNSTPLIYGDFESNELGFFAKVGINTKTSVAPLQIFGGTDVTLSNTSGVFILGFEESHHIAMDNNEIQARDNNVAADLYLQSEGGNVRVGGAVVHASDKRLKRDIETISYGLNEILQLRPTEYFWKGRTQDHKSLGLIAQEVDEVIKNVVTYNNEQDRYGVSYTELIPVLIKAIQEQQEQISELKAELSSLKE